jgi:murein DD-endopeptidase MepM/ murein hydrolase activator NlpD
MRKRFIVFGISGTTALGPVWSGIRDYWNASRREARERHVVRPRVEGLETRNLLSHATPMAAGIASVHSAAAEVRIPNYPYSGRGLPRDVLLRQVPVDRGFPSLENYKGVAVRKSMNLLNSPGKLELFSVGATIPFDKISRPFGVSHGVKNNGTDFAIYTGSYVWAQYPGTVVKVVKNWTPRSHDPNGNQVVVRTVEPDGIVFFIRYSHLLSDIKVKVGEYLSPTFSGYVGRAGHTGVPADQKTTFTITAWTPQFGGQFLGFGFDLAVLPVSIGIPPDFVDIDGNPDGSSDDPDNDADDPGGFGLIIPSPTMQ